MVVGALITPPRPPSSTMPYERVREMPGKYMIECESCQELCDYSKFKGCNLCIKRAQAEKKIYPYDHMGLWGRNASKIEHRKHELNKYRGATQEVWMRNLNAMFKAYSRGLLHHPREKSGDQAASGAILSVLSIGALRHKILDCYFSTIYAYSPRAEMFHPSFAA